MSLDSAMAPTMLRIHLKKSKMDQLQKGADIFIGKSDCLLCLVGAGVDYMSSCGANPGPFFKFANGQPLTKSRRFERPFKLWVFPITNLLDTVFGLGQLLRQPKLELKTQSFALWADGIVQLFLCISGHPQLN